jgi:geranylgeranyl pyrophosphate synthase
MNLKNSESGEFFAESKDVREKIRIRISEKTKTIPNPKLRDIILQRHSTSSLLKGVLGYFIHEGVGGNLSEDRKLELASGIEIFCSAGAILDNVMDGHEERNGKTTYLKEYGEQMQLAASQYVIHQGLKILLPFMGRFSGRYSNKYKLEEAIIGMIGMDIESSKTLEEQVKTIERTNGNFNSVPLVIAATTGTEDENKINSVEKYGFNLGAGLAAYEEIRDLLGKHGRRRATEVEAGRFILPFYYASQKTDFNPKKYIKKKLRKQEYEEMIGKLVQSGALMMSADLVKAYLNSSQAALREAVDGKCYQRLNNLAKSILSSLNELVSSAEDKL